jgi:hypothetical protein
MNEYNAKHHYDFIIVYLLFKSPLTSEILLYIHIGYTYDGQFLDYNTGDLSGEPHLFSAPSKESIHVSMLALAVSGNIHALEFIGGMEETLRVIDLKMDGYMAFNATYPAYGCFTPWVSFSPKNQSLEPAWDWSDPYRVPGLDNGEWFWALYALTGALEAAGQTRLAARARSMVDCQKQNVKTMFYRGNGDVSAVICILDPFLPPLNASNYKHCDGWLNDPYEGSRQHHRQALLNICYILALLLTLILIDIHIRRLTP